MSATWVRARPAITGPWTARRSPDRLEVARGGDREAGLDHVDTEPRQLVGDLELLLRVERDPRRLLAVAQRRVEDQYSVWIVGLAHVTPLKVSAASTGAGSRLHAAAGALFPPKGEEKECKAEAERHRA